MIFYKSDAKLNSGERPPYEIKVEAFTESLKSKDLELILNKA
jgi:hypothetical protein